MVIVLVVVAALFWGVPGLRRERPSQGKMVVAPPLPPGSAGGAAAPPASDLAFVSRGGPAPADGSFHREPFGGMQLPLAEVIPARKEHYGEPPGDLRAVHHDELGFRGWADMPGEYEGTSASALSAFIERSA